MDPLVIFSVLSGMSTLLGYSFRDLVRRKPQEKDRLVSGLSGFLASIEADDDPLVGVWTVNQWDYEYELHSHFHVSGNLAILYKDPHRDKFRATLYLRYQKSISPSFLTKPDGWIARRRGDCVDGAYNVEILPSEASANEYFGTSSQIYRNPRGIMDSGEFSKLRLDGRGRLVGEFVNTNTRGTAKVVFHQRQKWRELPLTRPSGS